MNLARAARASMPYVVGNLYFSVGVSLASGLSNSITSYFLRGVGAADSVIDFFHAFGGNFGFGLLVNFIPATFNRKFGSSAHFWISGNLMMVGMNGLMLGVHFLIQTENPVEARIVPTIASQALENVLILRQLRARTDQGSS